MRSTVSAVLALFAFAVSAAFVVQEPQGSLRDDNRVATVADCQGTALVRPVGRNRWTPLRARDLLLPGDQVRTPVRGANAIELRLAGGGSVLLGPGALIEVTDRTTVQFHRGELEVKGGKEPLRVVGKGTETACTGTTVLRGTDGVFAQVDEQPRWLTGYRSSTTDEWMGSLLAQVDGRAVPLSVGYHHVEAVIRDQIAQTTVEQSFVNSTKNRLEGVFYFPLPADASISGFGMWIGNELVEADIVEKQRARAIYEDILRRRKDPGLLEWSGGNLFKARVFPIEAHSEKRIRIRYTQVLPLEGSSYRYRYALRSEMLRQKPLRDLQVKVTVHSTNALKAVTSPSHQTRVRSTANAASLEFAAEEYAPDRDFEARIELHNAQPLTVASHRRGEDNYFMLLVSPPDPAAGAWQRTLLPERGPLDVLLIADTSGSMDPAARSAQAAFVGSLLAMLGDQDRFQLMTCDVAVRWLAADAATVDEASTDRAVGFLEQRPSMGWTDLDRAFEAAAARTRPGTTVIYVGDGIGTTGDADPIALAQRLSRLPTAGAAFHAVSASSTYEKPVLEAIASLGGGSVRALDQDPARTASELLSEVGQPAVKDLRIEFEGLRTARVYPQQLPNLPAGAQQIVLGRCLPLGENRRGRVVVTGTLEGKPIRYTTDVQLDAGESGNSFLPRLWARRHLDGLLSKGRSPWVKDEIVGFSQEFDIMTPYTSFLVLESDADRERYGVQRRVGMRDGEAFFAEGVSAASTELLRQHMERARTWRLRLRAQMLREIARLGRDLHGWSVAWGDTGRYGSRWRESGAVGGGGAAPGGRLGLGEKKVGDRVVSEALSDLFDDREEASGKSDLGETEIDFDPAGDDGFLENDEVSESLAQPPMEAPAAELSERVAGRRGRAQLAAKQSLSAGYFRPQGQEFERRGDLRQPRIGRFSMFGFPHLGAAPRPPEELADPQWDADVIALLRKLDRRPALRRMTGGVSVTVRSGSVHPLHGFWRDRAWSTGVFGADRWFVRADASHGEPRESWLAGGERATVSPAFGLGRKRPAVAADRETWAMPLHDSSLQDLVRSYREWGAEITARAGDRVTITLTAPSPRQSRQQLVIDGVRGVLLETRSINAGKVTRVTTFADFVEVAGQWWGTRIRATDGEDRVVWRQELDVAGLDASALQARLTAVLAANDDVIFVGSSDPKLEEARQKVHDGDAGFDAHFRVAVEHVARQQWDEAWKAWEAARKEVAAKPGAGWINVRLLSMSRRGEAFDAELAVMTRRVLGRAAADQPFLAGHLFALTDGILQDNERLGVLDGLRAAFAARPDDTDFGKLHWQRERARTLDRLGRWDEARAIWKSVAVANPQRIEAVRDYLAALGARGKHEAAVEVARTALERRWLPSERDDLFTRLTDAMWQRRMLPELELVLRRWVALEPQIEAAYARFLSVLLYRDLEADADRWIARELARPIDPNSDVQRFRLAAAINVALGTGWGFHARWIDERWHEPLAKVGRRLALQEPAAWYLAQRVINDWRFRRTDGRETLGRWLLDDFIAPGAIEKLDVVRLQRYVGWIPWSRTQVDADAWRSVVERMRARWQVAKKGERHAVAGLVLNLLDGHGERDEAIGFLRAWRAAADPAHRANITQTLLQRLAQLPWEAALETEMFACLPDLMPEKAPEPAARQVAADAVRWLAGELYTMRYRARIGPASEHEKIARAELRQRQREARKQVRVDLAAVFAAEVRAAELPWRRWLELERLCFTCEVGVDFTSLYGETLELLGAAPRDKDDVYLRILRARGSLVLAHAATRRDAAEGVADRVLKYYADNLESHTEDLDWRREIFRLLVVLDRVEQLDEMLTSWIVPGKVDGLWRKGLAYLRAETGRLADAAQILEEAAELAGVDAGDFENLANWYLVLGEDARRESALDRSLRALSEQQLSQRIRRARAKLERPGGALPSSFDAEVLRAMRTLLGKASSPAHYVGEINAAYRRVKDFRLLESLADGVIGHSPQGVYPFLAQCSSVLREVHEEATCDTLVARIAALRTRAKTDSDRRGLALLESLIERRASEVLNQPGPHVERGVGVMAQAFKGEWLPGEPRLMAEFLFEMGRITQADFAAEQIRQLQALHRLEQGALDRLSIAWSLHRTHWIYGRHDAAIDGMATALTAFKEAEGPILPQHANPMVDTLVTWLAERRAFARAEALLEREVALQVGEDQEFWYRQRLRELYVMCVRRRGTVSLGSGDALYREVRKRMAKVLWDCDASRISAVLATFCELHRAAHETPDIDSAGADLADWSKTAHFALLTRTTAGRADATRTVAEALRAVQRPRAALELYVRHLETQPAWVRRINQDGWQRFGWNLAQLRTEAAPDRALSERLLAVALRQLEHHLANVGHRDIGMMSIGHQYFWREKAGEFERVALAVAERVKDSPQRLVFVTRYLWHGLHRYDRAIALLLDADRRGTLNESGRWQVVAWLENRERWGEALAVLEKLVEENPDNLGYRTHSMIALHRLGRDARAVTLLDATDKLLKAQNRWNEGAIAEIASACLTCGFFERSVVYYDEVIPLHQRTHPNRGVGRGPLSAYYGQLAQAHLGLGQEDRAVDAAGAAVVSWRANHGNRRSALNALQAVLAGVKDLDAFVARRDVAVARSGVDAPLIRKMLGKVYLERKQGARAIVQLRIARELQSTDMEIHKALIEACDLTGDGPAAERALLDAIALMPRDLDLYEDLARRSDQRGDADAAERARTGMVEALPNEAESHRRLARHREAIARFDLATTQWQQVVRLRADEPDGWLGLAKAQIEERQWVAARRTLDHVVATTWDARFGDVRKTAAGLLAGLPASRPGR